MDDTAVSRPLSGASVVDPSTPPRGARSGPADRPDDDWGRASYTTTPAARDGQTALDLPPLPASLDPRRGTGRNGRAAQPKPHKPHFPPPPQRAVPDRKPPSNPAVAPYAGPHVGARRPTNGAAAVRRERGLPGWAALALLVVIAAIGGIIDTATDVQVRGGFNIGIVVASVVAILLVRRSAMLLIVLSPPIVYSAAAMMMLYVRSGGLDNRDEVINAALNYLVYGFPAIATATAVVIVVAFVRQLIKR
jgi:Domain of unknown function (DUF6542)